LLAIKKEGAPQKLSCILIYLFFKARQCKVRQDKKGGGAFFPIFDLALQTDEYANIG
jgi:hypothetical protein